MVEIDGSYGEGGGQILRTSLSLSCLLKKPFRIFNIRKNRKKPGLMPQHLVCVKAVQALSNAKVKGDNIGSTELFFIPEEVRPGSFYFDVKTAGSTSLILQTIVPSLIFSNKKSSIILKGGTHVPFSPSFHYIEGVFTYFLKKIGIEINVSIEKYGFYPRGGGEIRAEINPIKEIKPLRIKERGIIKRIKGYSGAGNLPISIAERQKNAFIERIRELNLSVEMDVINKIPTLGQGTFIYAQLESENSIAGFTSLGERGKRAEMVGEDLAKDLIKHYCTNAAMDPYISDQIILYLSICKEFSEFTTSNISNHLMTNLWVINHFLEFKYLVDGAVGEPGVIRIN